MRMYRYIYIYVISVCIYIERERQGFCRLMFLTGILTLIDVLGYVSCSPVYISPVFQLIS